MPEYAVLDKDTIKNRIMPYLSVAKRGFETKFDLVEIVNAILFKLKSGCQWRMLPTGHLFSGVAPSWKTVFHHYRKWCKAGEWKRVFTELLKANKDKVDLSLSHIDGSHTTAYRGGEMVEYQGRKKRNTTNALYLSDRNGLPLAMSEPQSGNHADLYEIEKRIDELMQQLREASIRTDGLFCNLDAGFDGKSLRTALDSHNVISNVCPNRRNGGETEDEYLFDEQMYSERWIVERTNAWMDGFKSILTRFDTTVSSWKGWNYLAFIVIFLKKIHKSK
ncbi:IS5 family transposase [Lepagella muris]|jgi:transposase|uniref:IS5 family transposase n=2 Tax=Lepagella muris TaxID=3032870 RepID=A0AC61RIP0_9BACT|nr:IS5 family transposase [Lepagella muris]ROT02201.1 IS5 family transposase [Muribaculaceae bacterium Isolate-037 (Harlan)]TGY79685.1 IS5 family transposase [Lepagella muris]THG51245.1 IS5 family transposase [Bacteroidales bacterium]